MENVKQLRLFPAGRVVMPPSKSLAHRAVMCAGMAQGGESLLRGVGHSEDVDATLGAMEKLGATYVWEGENVAVRRGVAVVEDAEGRMDCGESGTTLRLVLPLAALQARAWRFTGRGRLMARPMGAYAEVFRQSGVHFEQGAADIQVQGPLAAGDYRLPGDVSSQFVSGLLLALPLAAGDSTLTLTSPLESGGYVEMTLAVMERFGVRARRVAPESFAIPGGQVYCPADYTVEADYSQAAFFLAAGALGRPVRCGGLVPESLQGDAAVVDVLARMGVAVDWENNGLLARPGALHGADIDAREIPDLVPPLAALCCLARGCSHIYNAGRLRLKESDRLHALAAELAALGADIAEEADGLRIVGKERLAGGAVDAHGDHRIAMALAVAAIGCERPVSLSGWQHVAKSYPGFWDDYEKEVL